MKKNNSVTGKILLSTFVAILSTLLCLSCSDDSKSDKSKLGTVKLPLITVDENGRYRLEGVLTIEDSSEPPQQVQEIVIDENTDESALQLPLQAGRYTVTLQSDPPWHLIDTTTGEEVEASVVKSSLEFFVRPGETVDVQFDFLIGDASGNVGIKLDGGDLHTFYGYITLKLKDRVS